MGSQDFSHGPVGLGLALLNDKVLWSNYNTTCPGTELMAERKGKEASPGRSRAGFWIMNKISVGKEGGERLSELKGHMVGVKVIIKYTKP